MHLLRRLISIFVVGVLALTAVALFRAGYGARAIAFVTTLYSHRSQLDSLSDVSRDASSLTQAAESSLGKQVEDRVGQALGASAEQFSFDVIADIEPDYTIFGQHLAAIQNDGARFLVVNGDLTERGTTSEFESYTAFVTERLDVPFYNTPGNHDILQDGDTSTYASFFGARYFSFNYANSHFVLLDNASAARGFDEEQLTWLRNDLSSTSAAHTFLFMHRPLDVPFANLILGKDNELREENVTRFVDTIDDFPISAIFSAHVPGYLHYSLRETGIPVYASGGGGSESSISFLEQEYHYLHVRVNDQDFDVEKQDLPSP